MNICFLLERFTGGGIGRTVSVLGNYISQNTSHACFAYCLTNEGKANTFQCSFPHQYQFHQKISMQNAILHGKYVRKFVNYIKSNKIDLIVGCGALYFPVAVIAARMCRIKVICWEHTNPKVYQDYKYQRLCRSFGFLFSNQNIVLTKRALDFYKKSIVYRKTVQIYNPIDPVLLSSMHGYDCTKKKIISLGRLSYPKNFSRLLDIAKVVLVRHPEWTWDVYGEGPLREELENKRDKLGLKGKVNFCGQKSNIYDYFSDYAFVVMTSRYEGFPMTLLEAAANALPMVAFDIETGPDEIIKNGENGFLCSPDSDEAMIASIEELMVSSQLRTRQSINSKKTAETFRVEEVYSQWQQLIENMK